MEQATFRDNMRGTSGGCMGPPQSKKDKKRKWGDARQITSEDGGNDRGQSARAVGLNLNRKILTRSELNRGKQHFRILN